jgi:hypothetical protein
MIDIDQLFGAQQRSLRASLKKAEQDREMQRLADHTARRAAMLAKRRKRREAREPKPEPQSA